VHLLRSLSATGLILATAAAGAQTSNTTDQARNARSPGATLCSQIEPQTVITRLSEGWKRCFSLPGQPASVTVMIGRVPIALSGRAPGPTTIEGEQSGERKTLLVNGGSNGLLFFADIESTPECPSRVEIRGATDFINKLAPKSGRFVDAPDAPCPRDDPK